MGELIVALGRLDVSPLVALLLVALSAALRQIGRGLANRLDCAEARLEELETRKHQHDTDIAVLKARLALQEDTDGRIT